MEEDALIPKAYTAFNFTKIDSLAEKSLNTSIDIVGIIAKCEDVVKTLVKTETKERRQLELVDDSGVRVFTTFWGQNLLQRLKQIKPGDIIALRQVRVGDFNGRSLTASDMVEDIFTEVKHPRKIELQKFLQKWPNFESLLKESKSISVTMRVDFFCTIAEMLKVVDEQMVKPREH